VYGRAGLLAQRLCSTANACVPGLRRASLSLQHMGWGDDELHHEDRLASYTRPAPGSTSVQPRTTIMAFMNCII
jgi:hypothetical protein